MAFTPGTGNYTQTPDARLAGGTPTEGRHANVIGSYTIADTEDALPFGAPLFHVDGDATDLLRYKDIPATGVSFVGVLLRDQKEPWNPANAEKAGLKAPTLNVLLQGQVYVETAAEAAVGLAAALDVPATGYPTFGTASRALEGVVPFYLTSALEQAKSGLTLALLQVNGPCALADGTTTQATNETQTPAAGTDGEAATNN
jgi:hypothetical protein